MENGTFRCFFLIISILDSLQAPAEAEAELAYLNRVGIIDAVLSDDVDNFLFGATTVIRKCAFKPCCGDLTHTPFKFKQQSLGQQSKSHLE